MTGMKNYKRTLALLRSSVGGPIARVVEGCGGSLLSATFVLCKDSGLHMLRGCGDTTYIITLPSKVSRTGCNPLLHTRSGVFVATTVKPSLHQSTSECVVLHRRTEQGQATCQTAASRLVGTVQVLF
jgi:hypothetical protein